MIKLTELGKSNDLNWVLDRITVYMNLADG